MNIVKLEQPIEHNNGIYEVIKDFSIKEEKLVLWDFDSIFYLVLYPGKDEFGVNLPEYTEDDLELLQAKLTELTLKILNKVEEYFIISSLHIFCKGENNFRKQLYPEYKSNRKPQSDLLWKLIEYAVETHGVIQSHGFEAEDYVYTASNLINNQGIILFVDHDLREIPSLVYNFQKDYWEIIDEKTALYNKYAKLIISESGDNVNLCPGLGEKYVLANLNPDMSEQELEEAVYQAYIYAWSDKTKIKKKTIRTPNEPLAIQNLELAKQLLWLKNVKQ